MAPGAIMLLVKLFYHSLLSMITADLVSCFRHGQKTILIRSSVIPWLVTNIRP